MSSFGNSPTLSKEIGPVTVGQILMMAIAMVLGLVIVSAAGFTGVLVWVVIAIILYMLPHLAGAKPATKAVFGVLFVVIGLVLGAFVIGPAFAKDNSSTHLTGNGIDADITYTDTEFSFSATYSGTDTHDMVICYSEVDYISFKNAYLKNNINSIPTAAMTHAGSTYTGSAAIDSSKLYYVFLAFLNDDGKVNTSTMSHVTLTDFDYHGNINDYTVKGAIWAIGMIALFFFIVLGVTTFMRMRLAATRKKMEAQGRLYPQGYGRCNFCGAIVLPGQVNCPKCGAYIDRPESMKPHKKDYFVCSVCGCEVSPDMKECPKCGAQFDGEENVVTHKDGTSDVSEETKTCPNCGKAIPANSARCPYCGKKFE